MGQQGQEGFCTPQTFAAAWIQQVALSVFSPAYSAEASRRVHFLVAFQRPEHAAWRLPGLEIGIAAARSG